MTASTPYSPDGLLSAPLEHIIDTQPSADDGAATRAAGPPETVTLRAWISLGILLLLIIFSSIDKTVIGLMVDPIKHDLHLTDIQFSLLVGFAFASFYAVTSLPMGWLADRFSRHIVVFAGVTLWSIATATCAFTRGFGQLFGARLMVGAGEATLAPSSYAMLGEIFPPRRMAFAAGMLSAGLGIGGAIAYAGGGWLVHWAQATNPIPSLHPWQVVFLIVGLPGVLIAPLVFLIPGNGRRALKGVGVDLAGLRDESFLRWLHGHGAYMFGLLGGSGLLAAIVYGSLGWVPAYMMRHFHASTQMVGSGLGLVMLVGGVAGYPLMGWAIDRMHARGTRDVHFRTFIVAGVIVTVLGVVTFTVVQSAALMLVLLGVMQFVVPISGAGMAHLQMVAPPHFRARAAALVTISLNLVGMSVGPTLVAVLTEKVLGGPEHVGTGIALMFAILGPPMVGCFVIGLRATRRLGLGLSLAATR